MTSTASTPANIQSDQLAASAVMTQRQVLQALSGLLLGLFVAMLSSTVVSSSLPKIIADLNGDQAAYTWVVTSTLLAMTVSTPIWGKLADLTNRKLLIQISLVVFVLGSVLAGLAQDTGTLIGFRVVQGLGAGGLTALVQVVMADIISPRERGKYMGLMGAVMAVATVGGPLLGGVITDSIGWRWNFYVAAPFALAAIILLQKTLRLPRIRRKVSIDYWGALLIAAGISLLLIWVSLAGTQFDWWSTQTVAMVGGAVVVLAVAVWVELKVDEPIIPMHLFRNRTFWLAIVASISVGVAMFGTSVFLSQYMQLARGKTPTESGILTIPMVAGTLVASTLIGQLISRTGKWKRYMVLGSILLTVGLTLMGTIRYDTDFVLVSVYMFIMGSGVGMVMQNLVLVVQNAVNPRELGVASASVAFFRSLGGTIGVSVLGAVLGSQVSSFVKDGLSSLGAAGAQGAAALSGGTIPDLDTLPDPVRAVVEAAYGHAVGDIFLIAVPLAVITVVAIALLPAKALGTKTAVEQLAETPGERLVVAAADEVGAEPVLESALRERDAQPDGSDAGRQSSAGA